MLCVATILDDNEEHHYIPGQSNRSSPASTPAEGKGSAIGEQGAALKEVKYRYLFAPSYDIALVLIFWMIATVPSRGTPGKTLGGILEGHEKSIVVTSVFNSYLCSISSKNILFLMLNLVFFLLARRNWH
jgi:hypothetical protein